MAPTLGAMDTGLKAKTGRENGANKAVNLEASGQSTPSYDGKGDVIPMYRSAEQIALCGCYHPCLIHVGGIRETSCTTLQ